MEASKASSQRYAAVDEAGSVRVNPEEAAGWVSRVFMSYAAPTLRLGASRRLEERDCLPLAKVDVPRDIREAFGEHWAGSLRSALWRQFRGRLLLGFAGSIFFVLLTLAGPLTIRALVAHVSAEERDGTYVARGMVLVAVLTGVQLVDAVVRAHTMYMVKRVGVAWQSAMMATIFRRCLSLRGGASTGRLVALASVDSSRWPDSMPALLNAFLLPFWLALVSGAIGVWIGAPEACAGVAAALVLVYPVKVCGDRMRGAQRRKSEAGDARLKRSREFVSGVRCAKFMAWEHSFVEDIFATRVEEDARPAGPGRRLRGPARRLVGPRRAAGRDRRRAVPLPPRPLGGGPLLVEPLGRDDAVVGAVAARRHAEVVRHLPEPEELVRRRADVVPDAVAEEREPRQPPLHRKPPAPGDHRGPEAYR